MTRVWWAIFCATCVVGPGLASCDRPPAEPRAELVVFAAASLADVIGEIARRFEAEADAKVLINVGASGALRKQIEWGAAWDIYVPTATRYLDELQRASRLADGLRTPLATNALVVVTAGSGAIGWPDLSQLTHPGLGPIGIANPDHAPAGQYAQEALVQAGLWAKLKPRMVYANSVRLAAQYVADGGLRVGIVYRTDAQAFGRRMSTVYRFADRDHTPIEVHGAVHRQAPNVKLAGRFLAFAASEQSGKVWIKHGFGPPSVGNDHSSEP